MATLDITAKDFIRGESSADYVADGGFSPDSYAINLTKTRGVLYFNEGYTDRGAATLTGNIIASAIDPSASGKDAYFLDDEGAFYYIDGGTLTKPQDSASSFILGTSELFPFNGNLYATSEDSLHQLSGSALTDCERLWGAALATGYRHPIERVEDEMFVASQNVIYYLNNAGVTGTAFTLPIGVGVTSLRRHPDGRTLLAFTSDNAQNFSHTLGGAGKVYYCDPTVRDWVREVQLEAQVEGTRVVGGVVYCTYGFNFGFFDGNGLQPIKSLDTSATTYSHNISNIEDILLVRDGLNVRAYGDLGAGNVWWNITNNETNTQNVNCIHYLGDNKLLFAFSDAGTAGLLKEVDFDNAGTSGVFYSNRINFGEEVHIHRIDILHDVSAAAGTTRFILSYRDIDGTLSTIQDTTYSSQSVNKTRIRANIKTDIFQLKLTQSNDDTGYKLIRIFYDPV